MNLNEFIQKNDGEHVEVTGSGDAINQCVDLANAYIRDVLGLPIIPFTNAVDFPTKVNPEHYEYVKNSPTGVPQRGDLVIWKPTPGHIAVFLEGDTNRFSSFDQNFPLYSVCHVQEHNYTNVIGWLHPKVVQDNISIPKKTFEELVTKATKYDEFNSAGFKTVQDVQNTITSLQRQLSDLEGRFKKVEEERDIANRVLKTTTDLYNESQEIINDLTKQVQDLQINVGYRYDEGDILLTLGKIRLIKV